MLSVPIEPNTMVLLVVAVMNAATLYYSHRTEKNTNSMKDALVKSTAEASHLAGREEARLEGDVKAATLAKGELLGKG